MDLVDLTFVCSSVPTRSVGIIDAVRTPIAILIDKRTRL